MAILFTVADLLRRSLDNLEHQIGAERSALWYDACILPIILAQRPLVRVSAGLELRSTRNENCGLSGRCTENRSPAGGYPPSWEDVYGCSHCIMSRGVGLSILPNHLVLHFLLDFRGQ